MSRRVVLALVSLSKIGPCARPVLVGRIRLRCLWVAACLSLPLASYAQEVPLVAAVDRQPFEASTGA